MLLINTLGITRTASIASSASLLVLLVLVILVLLGVFDSTSNTMTTRTCIGMRICASDRSPKSSLCRSIGIGTSTRDRIGTSASIGTRIGRGISAITITKYDYDCY